MQPRPWSHQALSQLEPLLSPKLCTSVHSPDQPVGPAAMGCPLEVQQWWPQCCWGQPGTHFMDFCLWRALRHQSTNTAFPAWAHSTNTALSARHIPSADVPWTGLGVAGWALGTLFSSRADQATMPFVRMFSVWLEASGCRYNANCQINWVWLCIWIMETTWKFCHVNTSARHQKEIN